MTTSPPYDTDLAYIHDAGYGEFARNAAPGLLNIISQSNIETKVVVDLGCGSGTWAQCLVEAGYAVIGYDISNAMIEIARRRVPEGTFQVGSFLSAAIPRCRSVTALGEVLNYLFDMQNSLSSLQPLLQRIFDALVPDGVLIFDIAEPGRCRGQTQSFREGKDWTCLVEYSHDEEKQKLTRKIVTFRKQGDLYRRNEETHAQQLYRRDEIERILSHIGFLVEVVSGYGVSSFPPGLVGFVARKSSVE